MKSINNSRNSKKYRRITVDKSRSSLVIKMVATAAVVLYIGYTLAQVLILAKHQI